MIRSHRSFFALVLGVALFSTVFVNTHAQQDGATPPNKEEIAALREKAFKVLDSVAGQLNTLQSPENRARMGSNLVYSLWQHDEERARSLLRLVQEDIKTELQKYAPPAREYETVAVYLKLRQDTIERVSKYDPEAAFDFLKATQPVFERPFPQPIVDAEQSLELRLAKQVASRNPDVALKLGRQTLERGFSSDLITLLSKLTRHHEQQAQILYKDIVEKLRNADMLNDWNVRYFVQSLVMSFRPPAANEAAFRELVGIFVTKALDSGCANKLPDEDNRANFCRWVAESISSAAKYDARAARLKHWDSNLDYSPGDGFTFQEIDELLQENAFEQLEEIAEKRSDMRDVIYTRLVHQAISNGDLDRARNLIDRFVTDPRRRKDMLAQIASRETKTVAVPEETLAEIRKRLDKLATDKERAWFLLEQANRFGGVDPKFVFKLLKEAGEIIDTLKPGNDQTRLQIVMALLYSFDKNDRAFAIMESVVPKLNELVEVAVKLDGYDTNYLRDGEWNMSSNGSIGSLLTDLSQQAAYFAWFDFDRAVNLASQFERPEIRMMAHLKLAQSILAGPPKRLPRY